MFGRETLSSIEASGDRVAAAAEAIPQRVVEQFAQLRETQLQPVADDLRFTIRAWETTGQAVTIAAYAAAAGIVLMCATVMYLAWRDRSA